jgi:hypothetical protein
MANIKGAGTNASSKSSGNGPFSLEKEGGPFLVAREERDLRGDQPAI